MSDEQQHCDKKVERRLLQEALWAQILREPEPLKKIEINRFSDDEIRKCYYALNKEKLIKISHWLMSDNYSPPYEDASTGITIAGRLRLREMSRWAWYKKNSSGLVIGIIATIISTILLKYFGVL